MADVGRLSTGRFPGCSQFRAERLHARGNHPREELRDHSRDAPEQATLAEARELHHDDRLVLRPVDGESAVARSLGLPEVRDLPAVRDERQRGARVRGVPHADQRGGFSDTDGMLPEDVLRDTRFPGVELERLADREENGVARVYRFSLLVADRFLLPHGDLRSAASVPRAGEGFRGVRAAAQFLLQSVSVRDSHETIQEGLRADMQSNRGVARDTRHRPVSAQLELQQSADTR